MGVEARTEHVHEDSTVGVCLQREPDTRGTCSAPEAHGWHLFYDIALTPCFMPQAPKPSRLQSCIVLGLRPPQGLALPLEDLVSTVDSGGVDGTVMFKLFVFSSS